MITVLFFGPVAEKVGRSKQEVEFQPAMRLQDLRQQLQAEYPEAFSLVMLAAVNGEHVHDLSMPLADHSEVVFMSKFSGG